MTCSPLPPSCTPPFGVSPSPYPSSTSDCGCECPPAGPLTANSTLNGFVTWGNTVASQWTSSLGTADALGNLNVNSLSFFGGWTLPTTGGTSGQFLGYSAGGLLGWYAITDVYTAAGTANQILVNGSSGAPVSGPITLTLPTTLVAPGSITATTGNISLGQYTGAYTHGTVVDYVTGNGRFSVGPADTISFYTGGVGSTLMGQFSSTGLFTGYLAASGTAAVKASSAFTNYGFTVGALTPIASGSGFAIGINNGGTLQAQVSGDQLYNYLSDPTIATGVGLTTLTYTGVSVGTPSVTGSSGLQNAYQVYISAAPAATNKYGLYQGGTDPNVLGGSLTLSGMSTAGIVTNNGVGLLASLSNASTPSATLLGLLGSGAPSSSNYLRGDGTWAASVASAAGSNTQVQYNNGGALAGNAGLTWNGTQLTAAALGVTNAAYVTGNLTVGTNATTSGVGLMMSGANAISANGGYGLWIASQLTAAAANTYALEYIAGTFNTSTYTGNTLHSLNIGTPTVNTTGGGSVTGGYQINVAAPAAGMTGAISVTSGAVNLGSGTTTVGALTSNGNVSVKSGLAVAFYDSANVDFAYIKNTGSNDPTQTLSFVTSLEALTINRAGNVQANSTFGVTGASTLTGITTLGSASGGNSVVSANAGANYIDWLLVNTSGEAILGIEGSAGGNLAVGTAAYSTVFGAAGAKNTYLLGGGAIALTLDTSQNATFAAGIILPKTIAGSTGAQTINKASGSVQFAGAATSLVVTNSLVSATSIITCQLGTNDATAVLGACVPAAGSFTIFMKTAPTGTSVVMFRVTN